MRHITMTAGLLTASIFILSCQAPFQPDGGAAAADTTARSTAGNDGSPVVSRLDDGMWIYKQSVHPRYQPHAYAVWIDAAVQNLSPKKNVTIIWTEDSWETAHEAAAEYKATLDDGKERWGTDIYLPQGVHDYPGQITPVNVEYALRVDMNGQTYYDPRNNHFVGDLQDTEVSFMGGNTQEAEDGSIVYSGIIAVENIAYEKEVTVVYTRDNWETIGYSAAEYEHGNTWSFTVPLPADTPHDLEFAVEYKVAGATYWDNNDGENYRFRIGPDPILLYPQEGELEAYTLQTFQFRDKNSNKTTTMTVYANGTEVQLDRYQRAEFKPSRFIRFPQHRSMLRIRVAAEDEFGYTATNEYIFNAIY